MFFEKAMGVRMMLLFLTGLFLTAAMPHHTSFAKKRFYLEEGSRLYLKGSSNVNEFTCDCVDQFGSQTLDSERKSGYVRFRNVDLHLKTKKLDCKNRKIDTDLQKALKSDQYPNIKVSLVETKQNEKCLDGECVGWFDVQAKVNITITNVTKEVVIPAKAKKLGHNRLQLKGNKDLYMSTFGVEPPEAMFGMIKVNDLIAFHFDLIITVEEVQ